MANDKIEFDVLVNGSPAVNEINKVKKAQDDLEKTTKTTTEKMQESWVSVGAKVALYGAALTKAYDLSQQQVKAEIQLQTALANSGNIVNKNLSYWKDYASQLQANGVIGDELILKELAFGTTLGLTDEQMKAVTQTALDLSIATGSDLHSAFVNLSKTLSGNRGELGEMFPALQKLTAEEMKAGGAIALVAEAVKGQNEQFANSQYGQVESMMNTLGDEFERLGNTIMTFASDSGILWLLNKALQSVSLVFTSAGAGAEFLAYGINKILGRDTTDNLNEMKESFKEMEAIWGKLSGSGGEVKTPEIDWEKIKAGAKKTAQEISKNIGGNDLGVVKTASKSWFDLENEKLEQFVSNTKAAMFQLRDDGALKSEDILPSLNSIDEWATSVQSIIRQGFTVEEATALVIEKQKLVVDESIETMKTQWDSYVDYLGDGSAQLQSVFQNAFNGMEDAIVKATKTGKINFKDMANSIMEDLLRMTIRMTITKNLASGIGSSFGFSGGTQYEGSNVSGLEGGGNSWNAQGNVFSSSGQERYAQGGIFNAPTDFRFAGGTGILGEKGSEAIMPLKRTSNGDLGVVASGGASNVKVEVINQSSQQVQANDVKITKSEQEGMIVSIVVGDIQRGGAIAQAIRS